MGFQANSDLAYGARLSEGVSRIIHKHLVKHVVKLYTFNYQHSGLLSPNCLSTNNSYVLQGLSALNNSETDIRSVPLKGLFSSTDTQTIICYRIMVRPCSISNQAMTYRCIDNVHFIEVCTLGTLGIRAIFICNSTTQAHHQT